MVACTYLQCHIIYDDPTIVLLYACTHTQVANHTIIMLLGLAFCCVAPLIAPFCLLYFTLSLLAQQYQLVYVMTLPYDAAGRMWGNVS